MRFTSLAYLMDLDWLREAYRRTRKDAAVGVDGQTAADYEQDLEANLQSLLDRAQSGLYTAPPVKRVQIPKPGTPPRTRPIGIPSTEDKLLQTGVKRILEAIYEPDFLPCSFGYRLGRGPQDAVKDLTQALQFGRYSYVVEADICGFFDHIDHHQLGAM